MDSVQAGGVPAAPARLVGESSRSHVAFEFVDADEAAEDQDRQHQGEGEKGEGARARRKGKNQDATADRHQSLAAAALAERPSERVGEIQSEGRVRREENQKRSQTGCWPFKASQVSARVGDCAVQQQQQQQQAGQSSKSRKKRSQSLEAELEKIRMHEKLLVSNQKKLFTDLNQELSRPANENAGQAACGFVPNEDEHEAALTPGQVKLDMQTGELNAAVEIRNLVYQAGLGGPLLKTILHGVNLSVPEGSIYGLLGPSGCGKTTMLRCVAGRLSPTSGQIRVFGYEPNEPGSRIPGPAIGYMPQEISVYEEFTIQETLGYFGRINRMRASVLRARIGFLLKFLNLPPKNRLIKTLSGGQKRRVSLAVALIHSPPLLILDEPTVGVDPLLRQIIWRYLVTLATADKITIVITTHYIEEARQANIVGLMRDGRMLAEDRPQALMARFQQVSLENVFLRLCLMTSELGDQENGDSNDDDEKQSPTQGDGPNQGEQRSGENQILARALATCEDESPASSIKTSPDIGPLLGQNSQQLKGMERGQKYAPGKSDWKSWFAVLWAVTWKNYLRLRRNPPVIAFEFILPAFQVVLFCLCIGGDPFGIQLAIVNEETVPQASKLFLNSISKSTFNQVPYQNLSSAIESVERGHSWAVVHIPEGYTRNLNERLLHPADATNETVANGTIQVYPDLTNLHLALTIENAFRAAFEKFARETLDLFGYDTQLAELPIRVARPIYGSLAKTTSGYLEFMAPGVIISITYVMATGLTALAFVLEKRDGLLERSQVSGVTTSQILLAHALLQVFVMIFQIALVLAVSFYVFEIPSRGPFLWVSLLVLLQGCTGMAFGLLISAICSEENTAVMLLVGTFYINLILAGIIWPVEAMPMWLRFFSYAQPQTLPTEGLRNILSRGWSIGEPSVQYAFLITLGWLVVFLLGAGLCMRHIK